MSQYPPFFPMPDTIPLATLDCEWPHCTVDGYWFITYGCLDGHIKEKVVCKQHQVNWNNNLTNLRCGICMLPIELAMDITVRSIHSSWLTGLLRDQSARKVEAHFRQTGLTQPVVFPGPAPLWNHQSGKTKTISDYYKNGRNRPA